MIKILIVEDDMVDRMAISRMIKKKQLPFHFDLAESVRIALDHLHKNTYHFIISDLNLGDGRAEDIIEKATGIPYILISGSSPDSPTYASSPNQAYAVLEKDPQLNYLEELPAILSQFFCKSNIEQTADKTSSLSEQQTSNKYDEKINIERLMDLFDQNITYVLEMVNVFLEQNPIDLKKLVNFTTTAQLGEAGKIAHRMKSGYNMMGLKRLHQLAEAIEEYCLGPQAQQAIVLPMVTELEEKSQTAYLQLQSFAHAHH